MLRFALLLPLVIVLGCGPPLINISGKVSYDGTPIEEGSISFESPDGNSPSIGGRIDKGVYQLEKISVAFVGKKVVRIVAMLKTGKKIPAGPPFPPDKLIDETIKIPTRFNEKSTLSAEISSGNLNQFDFILSKQTP